MRDSDFPGAKFKREIKRLLNFCIYITVNMTGLSVAKIARNRNLHTEKIDRQVLYHTGKLNDTFSDNNSIIIGDSKVRHLFQISNARTHVRMLWRKGAAVNNSYLNRETVKYIMKYRGRGPVTILLWHGTCELTTVLDRKKGHINISNRPDLVNRVAANYMAYKQRIKTQFPETRVLFIKVPMYSIVTWNKQRKHPNPEIFQTSQQQLEIAITELNSLIKSLNEPVKVPCISQDMYFFIKKKKNQPQTRNINFDMLLDGVHPKKTISTLWLARLKQFIDRE